MPAVLLGANNVIEESEITPDAEVGEFTHLTGFLVLIDLDGNYLLESDINKPVTVKRKPNAVEVKSTLAVLQQDMQTQEIAVLSANAVAQMQMQMAKQMAEAQQNAQVQQMLAGKK